MEENNNYLKNEAEKLMAKKGRTKGSELITFATYIREKKGEEGLRAVEEKMKDLGYPFHFDEVKELGKWYPEGLNVLAILVAKHIFNWTDKDIFDFGYNSAKYSFLLKLFMKYFVSFKKIFEGAPRYWRKFLDVGEVEAVEFNDKEKYLVLHVKGYNFHPIMCHYIGGYFLKIAENSIRSPKVEIKETKCSFKGDPYHEYIVSWQ